MSKVNGKQRQRRRQRTEGAMMRVGEAARLLGWSEWQVLCAARRGTLPCRRDRRAVWFSRPELARWIQGHDRAPLPRVPVVAEKA